MLRSLHGFFVAVVLFGLFTSAYAETGPRLGTWDLTGKDRREWKAILVFTKRTGNIYEGYFRWRALSGEASSGHEPFQGILNPSTNMITLKGLEMNEKQGNIATGSIYEATVSKDGTKLRNGRWFGPDVAPGVWTADWQSSETPKP